MAQLVEALRHKLEGRGFDSRWGYGLNFSGFTIVLGLIEPLTEMGTRCHGGKRWPGQRADKLTPFKCQLSRNSGIPNALEP